MGFSSMKLPLVTILITAGLNIIRVSGHGYLIDPPSRSSAWRKGFPNPINYDDNGLNCGGFGRQWTKNGGKCGVCGDPYDAPQPHPNEIGGKYANGIIVGNYTAGQVVSMTFVITAYHKGWFEFRLCKIGETLQKPTTQQCLDQNLLSVNNSNATRYVLPTGASAGRYTVAVKLPEGITCEHCVLQWKYHSGNNWGTDPAGKECLGCGPQEEFINCADIRISETTRSTENTHSTSRSSLRTSTQPTPNPTQFSSTKRISSTSTTKGRTERTKSTENTHRSSRSSLRTSTEPTPNPTRFSSTRRIPSTSTTKGRAETTQRRSSSQSSTTTSKKIKRSSTSSHSTKLTSPLRSTSESLHDVVCKATGLFKGNSVIESFCASNCGTSSCPNSICECTDTPPFIDYTKCKAVPPWNTVSNMDDWCVSNCAAGYCPPSHCICPGN